MPKIEIVEYDLTSPGANAESLDVAYVPGFVDVMANFDDYSDALPVNKPTLFTNVNQFETLCGKQAPKFKTNQYYRDVASGITGGFDDVAVPYSGIMFAEGDCDPGYVMAKELLNAGLNVLFERVNTDGEYKTITTAPSDFAINYSKYEMQVDYFEKINTGKMPTMVDLANGTVYDSKAKYYTRVEQDNNIYYRETPVILEDSQKTVVYDDTTLVNGVKYIKSETDARNIYYKMSTVSYYLANELESSTEYVKDKYYKVDNTYGFIIENSETAPEGFPKDYYSLDTVSFEDKSITIESQSVSVKSYPEAWITDWANKGNIKTIKFIPNTSNQFDTSKTYRILEDNITIKVMYNALPEIFDTSDVDGLVDKGTYTLKYLTTGGYPVYEYNQGAIVDKMVNFAYTRGDCVAFIDHTDNIDRDTNIDHKDSLYYTVTSDTSFTAHGDFATMFTPWATYNRMTTDKTKGTTHTVANFKTTVRMPASFAYLTALADSIKTNANWLAIAGSARGTVLNIADNGMTTNIPNGAADKMNARDGYAINPITNINPYGYVIWGNRTLKDNASEGNLTATSFLNIRNMCSDIKKVCYRASRKLTFEQNNDILWVNFKSLVTPTLDNMLTGYGITGYKMVIDNDKLRELGNPKATLCVKIIIFPSYPVEDFYISLILKDDEVNVAEA